MKPESFIFSGQSSFSCEGRAVESGMVKVGNTQEQLREGEKVADQTCGLFKATLEETFHSADNVGNGSLRKMLVGRVLYLSYGFSIGWTIPLAQHCHLLVGWSNHPKESAFGDICY